MFPSFRDSGPFLNLLPFPTGGGSAPTVVPGTPTVVGTQITFPSTSSGSLVGAVYGVEFGIGVGAGYVWSENVAGAASSQTIKIDIATYGGTTSSTVNARIYYNLDVLDDPSTRVYSAMLAPIVVSASETGTTTEGQTLTGANGIIVGGYQMTLSQSWSACNTAGTSCTPISAGTATTYVLTASEVGDTIKYTKTATNTAGSGSATSAASAVVQPNVVEGTFTNVQAWSTTQAFSGTSLGFNYGSTPTAGDLLIVCGIRGANEAITINDTIGDSNQGVWNVGNPATWNAAQGNAGSWWRIVGTGPSGTGVTISGASSIYAGVFYSEWSVDAGTPQVTGTPAQVSTTGTNSNAGPITTDANSLVVGAVFKAVLPTAGAGFGGFTRRQTNTNIDNYAVEDARNVAAQTSDVNWVDAGSGGYVALGIAFKSV